MGQNAVERLVPNIAFADVLMPVATGAGRRFRVIGVNDAHAVEAENA